MTWSITLFCIKIEDNLKEEDNRQQLYFKKKKKMPATCRIKVRADYGAKSLVIKQIMVAQELYILCCLRLFQEVVKTSSFRL